MQIESDNQAWILRFDLRNDEYKIQLQIATEKALLSLAREIQAVRDYYEGKLALLTAEKENHINNLT